MSCNHWTYYKRRQRTASLERDAGRSAKRWSQASGLAEHSQAFYLEPWSDLIYNSLARLFHPKLTRGIEEQIPHRFHPHLSEIVVTCQQRCGLERGNLQGYWRGTLCGRLQGYDIKPRDGFGCGALYRRQKIEPSVIAPSLGVPHHSILFCVEAPLATSCSPSHLLAARFDSLVFSRVEILAQPRS